MTKTIMYPLPEEKRQPTPPSRRKPPHRPAIMGPWIPSNTLSVDERIERAQMQRFANKANAYLRKYSSQPNFGINLEHKDEPTVGFIVSRRPAGPVAFRTEHGGLTLEPKRVDEIAGTVLDGANCMSSDSDVIGHRLDNKVLKKQLSTCCSTRRTTLEAEVTDCLIKKGLHAVKQRRVEARSRANSAAASRLCSRQSSPRVEAKKM
eukprot:TRINITY_DN26223_c0_g1_i1.p1 TRINITY_DN26223_c0_g1~~TRINITY_DN26223_c0_g1_i1.p1  ORF type:complete len:206 (+),score=23.82 TRINITY_DN26223_c0_g1_i1:120-737(+)